MTARNSQVCAMF